MQLRLCRMRLNATSPAGTPDVDCMRACQSAWTGLLRRCTFQLNMKTFCSVLMSLLGASFRRHRAWRKQLQPSPQAGRISTACRPINSSCMPLCGTQQDCEWYHSPRQPCATPLACTHASAACMSWGCMAPCMQLHDHMWASHAPSTPQGPRHRRCLARRAGRPGSSPPRRASCARTCGRGRSASSSLQHPPRAFAPPCRCAQPSWLTAPPPPPAPACMHIVKYHLRPSLLVALS